MSYEVYDDTACRLGEGPLWHPERNQLFWFDIVGMKLLTQVDGETRSWDFDEHVSAAGWVDHDTLIIASETQLMRFDIETGESEYLCALEAENVDTRSNDGRADPWGGFWIGTMGKKSEIQGGAIYRYYRGELRKLFPDITITNSICFAPDKSCAYYCDTVTDKIMRVALGEDGWPEGASEVFIDDAVHPDGSVTDADGNVWSARWGSWCVVCYAPDGTLLREIEVGAAHASCPAFGGENLRDLFVTSALQGLSEENAARSPDNGKVFVVRDVAQGVPEPKVIL